MTDGGPLQHPALLRVPTRRSCSVSARRVPPALGGQLGHNTTVVSCDDAAQYKDSSSHAKCCEKTVKCIALEEWLSLVAVMFYFLLRALFNKVDNCELLWHARAARSLRKWQGLQTNSWASSPVSCTAPILLMLPAEIFKTNVSLLLPSPGLQMLRLLHHKLYHRCVLMLNDLNY